MARRPLQRNDGAVPALPRHDPPHSQRQVAAQQRLADVHGRAMTEVPGDFMRRLWLIHSSVRITLDEDVTPSVQAPITNRGFAHGSVDLATLKQAAEALRADANALLNLIDEETASADNQAII
jgi:hypothetical protein